MASVMRRGRVWYGDQPGLADVCLFAQIANNRRFDVDMSPYPTLQRIYDNCMEQSAFVDALPEKITRTPEDSGAYGSVAVLPASDLV